MSSDPSYGNSDISWGPWNQLANGQWHREGQDSSGNWYQEDQDVDPTAPRGYEHFQEFQDIQQSFGGLSMGQPSSSSFPFQNQYQGEGQGSGAYDPGTTGHHIQSTLPNDAYSRPSQQDTKQRKNKHGGKPEPHGSSHHHQDKGRSSKTSKGDSKGYAKGTKPRTDVKGKGRETEQQFADPPSANYAELPSGNVGQFDPNFVSELPPGLQQDVANVYDDPGTDPSSGAAYYPAAEEDENDPVAPLPVPTSNSKGRSRPRSGPPGVPYNEDWSLYIVQPSRKFTFGTVFKCMWSEPMGNTRLSRHNKDKVGTDISISEFGTRDIDGTLLYEGIRRFVVIDGTENNARNGNSICVPIATYRKQGCMKHGIKPQHHGVIHTQDTSPMLLNGEPDLGHDPVRLVVNSGMQGIERLAPESRVNYSKHVTIEHNSVVHLIGRIHDDDLHILEAAVDAQWKTRVESRKAKKDKKQERSRR